MKLLTTFLLSFGAILPGQCAALTADEIVRRSVVNNNADWKVFPQYSFTERDVITKADKTTRRRYEVLMIEGSPYNKLLAINGEPISRAQAAAEDQKLKETIARRRHETAEERRKRIASYETQRRQDRALMTEMIKAFEYKLIGQETVNGHSCYVLDATPRLGYEPPNRDTKVLTGMRGRMWIDAQQFQWVKVHAEVFRPVAFGLFFAHVEPGTEFTLEEGPVAGNLWLPTHFVTKVRANILYFWSHNSTDEEWYSNYRPMSEVMAQLTPSRP